MAEEIKLLAAPSAPAAKGLKHHWLKLPIHIKSLLVLLSTELLLLALGALTYIFIWHGSLANIYLGDVQVKPHPSATQIENLVSAAAQSYRLAIAYPDGNQKYFAPSAAGLMIDQPASVQAISQSLNRFGLGRLEWWLPLKLSVVIKTDQAKLDNFIKSELSITKTPAKNAELVIDGGAVTVTPEAAGSNWSLSGGGDQLKTAVSQLQPAPLKLKAAQLQPTLLSVDLTAPKSKVVTILSQKVSFNIDGNIIAATPADIGSWIELTPIAKDKTVDVSVNSGKVADYINQIAKPFVTPARSRLIMTQADGSQVVLDEGKSGLDVLDKPATATHVASQIASGSSISVELPVQYAAAKTVQVQPAPKWIVIDVTAKRLYTYEQTSLVQTFLISAGAPATPTVLGQYAIYSKSAKQDMRGANADGSRYFQPDVPYVNYFHGDYAIHGNYWRPNSYFGNVNSSHGCVGIRQDDAAWLYDWAPTGTPVYVHN